MKPLYYLIPRVLRALGAPVFIVPGYEADDVMATLGQWAKDRLVLCVRFGVGMSLI